MGQGNSSQNFRPLDLEKLTLWFAEFEQACKERNITEVDQYTYLLKEIPREYEKDVLAVASKSFREGHYQRLKDALIDAVHPKTDNNNLDNADIVNNIDVRGTGGVSAKTITMVGSDKLGPSSDRRTVQNRISTKGEAKVEVKESFNLYASPEAMAAAVKAASTPKASTVQAEPDAFYEMGKPDDPKRGKLIIFNFENYPKPEDKREGTEKDVEALKETFAMLNFDVEVFKDLKKRKIYSALDNVAETIEKNYHCLVIAILAHGENDREFICSDWEPFTYKELYAYFTGNECPTLADKPKIFLIQACRGDATDSGVKVNTDSTSSLNLNFDALYINPNPDPSNDPKTAHFLKVYSCSSEYLSIRDPSTGSWCIQTLCRIINENWQTKTLLDMVMKAQFRVARKEAIESTTQETVKQMMVYESSLLKGIKFY